MPDETPKNDKLVMEVDVSVDAVTTAILDYAGMVHDLEAPVDTIKKAAQSLNTTSALISCLEGVVRMGDEADRLKRIFIYGKEDTASEDAQKPIHELIGAKDRLGNVQTGRLFHSVLGCITEAAEMASQMLNHLTTGEPIDLVNLIEEQGDTLWYLQLAANAEGISILDIMQANYNKLRTRFGDKFSESAVFSRDLTAERSVLESSVTTRMGIKTDKPYGDGDPVVHVGIDLAKEGSDKSTAAIVTADASGEKVFCNAPSMDMGDCEACQ